MTSRRSHHTRGTQSDAYRESNACTAQCSTTSQKVLQAWKAEPKHQGGHLCMLGSSRNKATNKGVEQQHLLNSYNSASLASPELLANTDKQQGKTHVGP